MSKVFAMAFGRAEGRSRTDSVPADVTSGHPRRAFAALLLAAFLLPWLATGQTVSFSHYSAPADLLIRQMVSGPDGALWFTATYFENNGVIGRVTTSGNITQYSIPATGCTPGLAGCPNLLGITVGFDNAVWFAENKANKIGRVSTSGSWSDYLLPSSNFNGTWIDGPSMITLGPDGACWFLERTANKIGRIDTSGRILEYSLPAKAAQGEGIAVGPDGALWFTKTATDKIGRIDTSGNVSEYSIPSASRFTAYPRGIVTGPDGALWFTEGMDNNIGRITASGTVTEYPIPSGNAGAGDITVGADGALWFTEGGLYINGVASNRIGRITTSGTITEYDIPNSGYTASSIAKGSDGALWFIESPPNLVSSTDQIWRLAVGSPATISSISPNMAAAGNSGFTLTANGTGFVSGSTVQWNGASLATTYVGATQLTGAVPANLIASAGSANITVINPGGTVSNTIAFTINPPVGLAISSLNPSSAIAGNSTFTLTVNGTGFVSGSAIRWNGNSLTTSYVGTTQLTASVSASLIATAGTANVTVINPGGTASNSLTFTINPHPERQRLRV
jgi:virginiamycin B lyase